MAVKTDCSIRASSCRISPAAAIADKFNVVISVAKLSPRKKMANLSLLVVLVVGALCVEGLNHKSKLMTGEAKRDMKALRDVLENWREEEMEKEELLEIRDQGASGSGEDSDDTDESGEAEESAEGERFCVSLDKHI